MSELPLDAALYVGAFWCIEPAATGHSMAARTIRLARTNEK